MQRKDNFASQDARVTYERVEEEPTPVDPSSGGSQPRPVPAGRAGAATPLVDGGRLRGLVGRVELPAATCTNGGGRKRRIRDTTQRLREWWMETTRRRG